MTRNESGGRSNNLRREKTSLTKNLDADLFSYALAATIAGVALSALAQPAEAHVVATSVNIPIPTDVGLIQFDINHDGIPDFGLSNYAYGELKRYPEGNFVEELEVFPAQAGNAVWEILDSGVTCAAAVPAGDRIGGARKFLSDPLTMWEEFGSITRGNFYLCPWRGTHPPYLGLKFLINGEVHYGWARVNIQPNGTFLTGFAYETVANKAILAGATSNDESDDLSGAYHGSKLDNLGTIASGWPGSVIHKGSRE